MYPAREFRSEPRSIIYSGATITTVAASDWLNGVIQGNSSGELIGSFPHQLMVGLENDRTLKYKKVVRYSIVKNVAKIPLKAFELRQIGGKEFNTGRASGS